MRTRAATMVSVALAAASMPFAAAYGQVAAGETPRGLSAEANLKASYEDNVFRSFTTSAGHTKADYLISPSLSARYDVPVSGQGIFVRGAAGYNFYMRNDDFNRGWWNVGAGVNWRLGTRCSGVAEAGYSQTQSDFGDLGVAVDNLEKRQSYSINASCAGPAGIGLVAGADYSKTENTFFARERGDIRSYSFNGGLLYRSVLVGDITLRGAHEDRKFPNRFIITPLGLEQDGVKVDRVSLGVTRPIGARLTGSASLSYIWSKPDISVYDKFKGVGWSAELAYLVGPRLDIGISASRDVTSSAAIDSSYQVTRSYGANARYKLSEKTSFSAGASHTKRSYRGQEINPLFPLPLRGTEKTQRYYAEARYDASERWGLSLRYLHDKRNSDGTIYDYTGNTVSLNATVRY